MDDVMTSLYLRRDRSREFAGKIARSDAEPGVLTIFAETGLCDFGAVE